MNGDAGTAAQGLVLAWDTCTLEGTLAAGRCGELIAESRFLADRGHTWWLMPQVESMLAGLDADPTELTALAVGTGPGGFTGVKVGVSTAKAIAMALGIPLVGASTLDVLAAGATDSKGPVLAVIDAKRGMFYAAAYRRGGGGLPVRLTEYLCLEPAGIAGALLKLDAGPVLLAGEVAHGLEGELAAAGVEVRGSVQRSPGARDLLAIAWDALTSGDGRVGSGVSVLPTYLKKPV